jgi:glucose 1-dehydrogenase
VGRATAIVTGGAHGIGAATARRLAADGYAVGLLDVDPAGSAVADSIREAGGSATYVECDVAYADAWEQALEEVRTLLGPVGVLVSNALVTDPRPLHETTFEAWQRQLDVNLTGTFHGVRACLPDLLADESGSVVIVSSVHAWFGLPGVPGYAASKAGLTGLTRQLAAEYGASLRVNCVLPGPVLTSQWDRISPEDRDRSASETLLRRLGRPEEVASVISFLASEDASYVTGATLAVDGGWSVTKNSA